MKASSKTPCLPIPDEQYAERKKNVLFIDDNIQDFRLISIMANNQSNDRYNFTWCKNYDKSVEILEKEDIDIVAVDFHMGEVLGTEVIEKLKRRFPDSVYMLVTGSQNEDLYRDSVSAGADEFVPKDKDTGLVFDRIARYSLEKKRQENEAKRANNANDPLATLSQLLESAERVSESIPKETLRDMIAFAKTPDAEALRVSDQLGKSRSNLKGHLYPKTQTTNLDDQIDQAIRLIESAAQERNIGTRKIGSFNRDIYTDPRMLATVLRNLLFHAMRISPPNENIEIQLATDLRFAKIAIKTKGQENEAKSPTLDDASPSSPFDSIQICRYILDELGAALTIETDDQNAGTVYSFKIPIAHPIGI